MSEQTESAFFPVPVRWFEIPMNTARWGFAHLSVGETNASTSTKARLVDSSASADSTMDSVSSDVVGKLLDEHA